MIKYQNAVHFGLSDDNDLMICGSLEQNLYLTKSSDETLEQGRNASQYAFELTLRTKYLSYS
jgi:hypothetical protein